MTKMERRPARAAFFIAGPCACGNTSAQFIAQFACMVKTTCLFILLSGPTWSGELAEDFKGFWRIELVPDMSCAVNPAFLELVDNNSRVVMTWPRAVIYGGQTRSVATSFLVTAIDGMRISVTSERDGISGEFILSDDRQSLHYEEGRLTGRRGFTRCDVQSS